ncbi:nickel pincer cofactor biosynthesis protein LarC [Trichlorobacter lovleyi]|uniref:nickel pincer cofactor biosynthesis protein LarC n=1 Tax=Trichlorobacter lovleyi TaxID=313985 RepID=UPI0022405CEA|nr:nickel pincer cofactor biosynthesis protein LarC [Trichlorobacter lovleyi]QOX80134.1 nickel pincer cofactor biosynthesis protein LarC [Trichlorobacter lovleyi]
MRILYLDATAGIAGDMTVAALLDLGVPLSYLKSELDKLGLPDGAFSLTEEQIQRGGMTGRYFEVHLPHQHGHQHHDHHDHRSYGDISQMIAASSLAGHVKELSQKIFLHLAEAEAKAHQVAVEQVQFHEVGAVDSIVDIVGTAIGLDWLKVDRVYCSAVPLGGGFVQTAHGRLPVPAPATAELLKGLAVHTDCGTGERVTPTGAAILAALAASRGGMPEMTIIKTGHGAGSRDFTDCPNILRGFLGELSEQAAHEEILELSCNLDDVTPELLGYTMAQLFAAGALDVWHTPIQMKKQRPGLMLSLLCRPEQKDRMAQLLMKETGSLGVRLQQMQRLVQQRRIEECQTSLGMVRFKISQQGSKPEYEDCCRIAREQGLALREVQQIVCREYDHER